MTKINDLNSNKGLVTTPISALHIQRPTVRSVFEINLPIKLVVDHKSRDALLISRDALTICHFGLSCIFVWLPRLTLKCICSLVSDPRFQFSSNFCPTIPSCLHMFVALLPPCSCCSMAPGSNSSMAPEQWIQLHRQVAQLSDTSAELAVELVWGPRGMRWLDGLDLAAVWSENLR